MFLSDGIRSPEVSVCFRSREEKGIFIRHTTGPPMWNQGSERPTAKSEWPSEVFHRVNAVSGIFDTSPSLLRLNSITSQRVKLASMDQFFPLGSLASLVWYSFLYLSRYICMAFTSSVKGRSWGVFYFPSFRVCRAGDETNTCHFFLIKIPASVQNLKKFLIEKICHLCFTIKKIADILETMAQFQSQWWSSVVEAVKDVAGFDEDKNIYKVEVGRYIEILHFFQSLCFPWAQK